MNDELNQIRKIWLDPETVDDEDRRDNEEKIKEWERALIENENFLGWQEHDVTKQILKQARENYKEISLILATNRELTDRQRMEYWGKQDAALWLITLGDHNAKLTLESINLEMRTALGKV